MKKMLKIVAVAALVVVIVALVGFAVLKVLASQPAAPDNYQQTVQAGGPIEQTYLANGSHEVLEHEDAVPQGFKKFTTYYPAELETGTGTYPVVVLCNGSGTPLSKYPAVARHLASWGFIVIGTEEDYSWNGFGAEMCLRYLERCNENQEIDGKPSLFYQKVDFDRVGIVGHSQGGVGVLNAVTDTDHKGVYKAAVALSPTNKEEGPRSQVRLNVLPACWLPPSPLASELAPLYPSKGVESPNLRAALSPARWIRLPATAATSGGTQYHDSTSPGVP